MTAGPPRLVEVAAADLVAAMWRAFSDRHGSRALGLRASEHVRTRFRWQDAARVAADRLAALASVPRARPRLSVCVISGDGEPLLAGAIESVSGLADEVIVVDTGPARESSAVAIALGASVADFRWEDDFAAARNHALSLASGDWVLVLDADERLDQASHAVVRELVDGPPACYLVRELSYGTPDEPGTVIEHLNLRLFPRHPQLRYEGRVHEQLLAQVPEMALPLRGCPVVIRHYGYTDGQLKRDKAERDLRLLRLAEQEMGAPTAFHAYNVGVAHAVLSHGVDAERSLREAIALAEPGPSPPMFITDAYVQLARLLAASARPRATPWSG